MSFPTYTTTPGISVLINGLTVGALRSFSERCVQDLELMRQLGSSDNLEYNANGKRYIIDLQYILPIGLGLVDAPVDPVALHDFSLKILLPDRTLRFENCVYESVQTSCEVGQSLLCTMRILAKERYLIEEAG